MTAAAPPLDTTPPSPAAPPANPADAVVSAWPRSAQLALGILILATVALLAWNVYGRSRLAAQPMTLDADSGDVFRLDLNRADRAQLLQLPRSGENLVSRIEAYRREHGGFHTVDDLAQVSGVGPVLLELWRPLVYVSPMGEEDDSEGTERTAMPSRRVVRGARPDTKAASGARTATKQTLKPGESLNINQASAADLQRLPGVGPAMAANIVDTRGRKSFAAVDDLRRVSGIGVKTLEKLRPFVRVE